MFYPDRTFKSALVASSQPLSVKGKKIVVEGQLRWELELDQYWENEIGNGSEAYPQL